MKKVVDLAQHWKVIASSRMRKSADMASLSRQRGEG